MHISWQVSKICKMLPKCVYICLHWCCSSIYEWRGALIWSCWRVSPAAGRGIIHHFPQGFSMLMTAPSSHHRHRHRYNHFQSPRLLAWSFPADSGKTRGWMLNDPHITPPQLAQTQSFWTRMQNKQNIETEDSQEGMRRFKGPTLYPSPYVYFSSQKNSRAASYDLLSPKTLWHI